MMWMQHKLPGRLSNTMPPVCNRLCHKCVICYHSNIKSVIASLVPILNYKLDYCVSWLCKIPTCSPNCDTCLPVWRQSHDTGHFCPTCCLSDCPLHCLSQSTAKPAEILQPHFWIQKHIWMHEYVLFSSLKPRSKDIRCLRAGFARLSTYNTYTLTQNTVLIDTLMHAFLFILYTQLL